MGIDGKATGTDGKNLSSKYIGQPLPIVGTLNTWLTVLVFYCFHNKFSGLKLPSS